MAGNYTHPPIQSGLVKYLIKKGCVMFNNIFIPDIIDLMTLKIASQIISIIQLRPCVLIELEIEIQDYNFQFKWKWRFFKIDIFTFKERNSL